MYSGGVLFLINTNEIRRFFKLKSFLNWTEPLVPIILLFILILLHTLRK